MIDIILMLLGLAFPNSEANTQTNNSQNPVNVEQTSDAEPGDTGGETQIPPKK